MGLFDALKKKKEPVYVPTTLPEDHGLHKEDFRVQGTYYHEAAFKRLQKANPAWRDSAKKIQEEGRTGKEIYHYEYVDRPVSLTVEDIDEYEKDALAVRIGGELVGYISSEDRAHVVEILRFGSIKYVTARIWGGEWKAVMPNGEVFKDTAAIRVSVRIAYSV